MLIGMKRQLPSAVGWWMVGYAVGWWLVGYLAITLVNGFLTLGLGMALEAEHGDAAYDLAYERTVAAHMLVGLAAWVMCAWGLWGQLGQNRRTWRTVALVSTLWLGLAATVDAVIFVGLLADTPAGAPADTFYIDNQPWTGLYYAAVVAGPPIAHLARRRRAQASKQHPQDISSNPLS